MQLTAILIALAAAFYLQYRRSGDRMVLMWFCGWVLVILRVFVLSIPAAHGHPWHQARGALADLCIILPALLFIGSFSPDTFGRKVRIPLYAAMALPIVLYTALASFWDTPTPMRSAVMMVLVLATMVVAGMWAMRPGYLPRTLTLALIACAVAASAFNIWHGEYGENFFLVESAADLCSAIFLLRRFRRLSGAIILTSLTFLAWAAWPWLHTVEWTSPGVSRFIVASIGPIHVLAALGMVLLLLDAEIQENIRAKNRERRARMEMHAYASLDLNLVAGGSAHALGSDVCGHIAAASVFNRVALFLRDHESNFQLAGHAGINQSMADALDALGRRCSTERLAKLREEAAAVPIGPNSFHLDLTSLLLPEDGELRMGFASVVAVPMNASSGRMVGALLLSEVKDQAEALQPDDLLPLESLASKVAIAIENSLLTQRIMRSEKLVGIGRLAGGVAHELNNPLTVVMGYAELIEESAQDSGARDQAAIIRAEATRMKRIIESLVRFGSPAPQGFHQVDVGSILRDIHALRAPDLQQRGIELRLTIAEGLPSIPGNADRLKQAFLQLLNNAVEAIGRREAEGRQAESHRIRMDLSNYYRRLHILFSDTGSGFANPDRIFEPFFTTKQPGEGAGLGLSICYGAAREHSGEINAFNMHPHGAAVVMELPVSKPTDEEFAKSGTASAGLAAM